MLYNGSIFSSYGERGEQEKDVCLFLFTFYSATVHFMDGLRPVLGP